MHKIHGKQKALLRINTVLNLHGTCLSNFDLPPILTNMMDVDNDNSDDIDISQIPENNETNILSNKQ